MPRLVLCTQFKYKFDHFERSQLGRVTEKPVTSTVFLKTSNPYVTHQSICEVNFIVLFQVKFHKI